MRILEATINARYREAKQKKIDDFINEHGYLFCESCKRSDLPLDPSHIISRADCKRYDLLELIYDPANIRFHCRECHHHWEDGTQVGNDTHANMNYIESICKGDLKLLPLLMKYKNRWATFF